MLGKLFVADPDSSRRAGIYTFADREAAEEYLQSELFQTAIARNPAIVNIQMRGGDLMEGPTRALDDELAAAGAA